MFKGIKFKKFISIILVFIILCFSCFTSVSAYQEGVTKVVPHSWGIEVYLSKSTVTALGGGVAIGGIWIPEPVVSKVLSSVGVVVSLCPGGIVLEYHYAGIAAKLLCPHPLVKVTLSHPTKFRWQ